MSDDFYKYVTPAAPKPKRQREFRTDRNNNPIAAAVTTGGRNQFTQALDDAEIPWEHGDPFPNNPKLSTIRIKGDPVEGARAILSNTNALKWYRSTTGKDILPKYGVKTNQDFASLPIKHQNEIINGIYASEGGHGTIKPTEDDFDKYVSTETPQTAAPNDDFDKYVTPGLADVQGGASGHVSNRAVPSKTTMTRRDPFAGVQSGIGAGMQRQANIADLRRADDRQLSMGEMKQADEQPIGFSKQGQPSRVTQTSDELRVMKGEQPVNRQAYSRQQDAQARLSQMRELGNDFDPKKEEQWHAANEPAIRRETEKYKQDIRKAKAAGGDPGAWLAEFGTKAAGGLAELGAGVGSNTLRIKAEAAARAAQEEGADRNIVSQFAQNTLAGFVSFVPELVAMKLGAPPAAVFSAGSALRAGGSGRDPNKAAVSGLGQALAFDVPVPSAVSEGFKGVAAKGVATAGASTLSELAMGQPLKEALTTGATTGLMRGVPEAARLLKEGAPERPEAINAQLNAVKEGTRPAILIPEGTARPKLPQGLRATRTEAGVFYYDPKQVDAQTIQQKVADGTHGELLGHVQPKSTDTTQAVVARDAQGNEIQSSAVSPENVEKQSEVLAQQYPNAQIESGGPEVAAQVVAERTTPQRFQHLQFGEVEVVPDQTGARAGRLKVAEVANPENIHYVKRADLQGRGNSQMLPIKSPEPAEAAPAEQSPEAASEGTIQPVPSSPEEIAAQQRMGAQVAAATEPTSDLTLPAKGEPKSASNQDLGATAESTSEKGAGGGQSEEIPPAPSTTSIKNAAVESAREVRNLPELTPADHKGWEEAGARAREQGLDQPDKADAIATEVVKGNKKQLTDEESAGLRDRLRGIENDYDTLARKTQAETDPDKIASAKVEGEALREKHRLLTDATKKAGTEVARALAIRRSAVDQDMLLTQLGAERSYKLETGKEPSKEVQEQIAKLVEDNARLKVKVEEHEEQRKNDQLSRTVKKVKREVEHETRRAGRQVRKEILDSEAKDLARQFAQTWQKIKGQSGVQPSILSRFDPEGELMKIAAKLVRNRVQANLGITAEALVDEVHSFLKDVADLDSRDVREMISGYGRKGKPQSELQRQLSGLRAELRKGLAEEDIAAGRRSAKREGPPNVLRANAQRNARIEKQIAELEQKIREEDFSGNPPRQPPVYDAEGNRLRAKLEQTRRDFTRLKEKNKQTTVADALVRWKRFAVLTYGTTVGKLTSAASGRMVASPVYEAIGQIGKHTPGLRSAFAEEPSTRGFLKGEKAAISQLWQSDSFRDFLSHLKGGEDLIELLYGEKGGRDEFTNSSSGKTFIPRSVGEVLDRPGHIHAALKTVPKRAAFFRQFERGLQKEIEKPLDKQRDIRDPAVQLAIAGEANAYLEAKRAILQQPNWVTNIFNNVVSAAARNDSRMARGFGKILQYRYPITKVPVNYVGESALHVAGLPLGVGEVAVRKASRALRPFLQTEAEGRLGNIRRDLEKRLPTAIEDLEPEQRKRIARAIKVGGVGLGFTVWGMMRPDQFGGYYQPGNRDPKDVKAGGMRFLGVNIPVWMGHIPPLEAAQFGATLRRVYDSMQKKNKEGAALEATKAATKGLAGEIPFNDDSLVDVLLGGEGKSRKLLGGELRSNVPGFLQQGAKAGDYPEGTTITERLNPFGSKEAIKRQPETIGQEVKMGIPGLRQTVPISKVFGSASTKASNEVQRLGVEMKGATKEPDELPEDFKKREALQNGNIRTQLENIVALPDYDKASDEDKRTWLKQGAQFATQQTKDSLPEKPEKKEEKQFPMPQASSGFERAYPAQALDKFERMNAAQRGKVAGSMAEKAWLLTHSPTLSEEQKAAFKERLDKLGIVPRPPNQPKMSIGQTYKSQVQVAQ